MQTPYQAKSSNSQELHGDSTAFDNAAVVLCQAEHAGNVGAVCRAMESMGFSKLILVQCPDYNLDTVKMYALKSYWIYEQAERFNTLEHALQAYTYAAGFTRRIQGRKQRVQNICEWTMLRIIEQKRLTQAPFALVFGNEQHGLTREELTTCDECVYIPTSERQPSLNLAQAVQLALWECRRAVITSVPGSELQDSLKNRQAAASGALSRTELDSRVISFLDMLEPLSFYKKHKKTVIAALMRSIFSRADVSKQELDRFLGFLEQTLQIHKQNTEDNNN